MPSYKTSSKTRRCQWIPLIIAVMVSLAVGLIIGWFASLNINRLDKDKTKLLEISESLIRDGFEKDSDPEQIRKLLNTIDAEKIKENLRIVVSRPHLAGTPGDKWLATYIKEQWEEHGLDDVATVPYDVLLSYTNPDEPNKVEIIDTRGEILYQSTLPPMPKEDNWTGYTYPNPYLLYSPSGVVVGDPLYVGYGSADEYEYLTKYYNINIAGNIFIVKHGGMASCGEKVTLAEKYGAIGVLMYLEPGSSVNGSDPNTAYPHSWWLPNDGIMHASAHEGVGDPLTKEYPSRSNLHYIPVDHANLPKIPVQPINAQDAKEILGRMGGATVPHFWRGKLDIAYHFGPKFADTFGSLKLKLSVNNTLKRQTIYNVIGTIRGKIEPDRYVMMGNHRDAWVKGAVDPGTGTAVMLELTRTLGKLYKEGWQPRRSLMFCSWSAEEFGLIGSTEWVEDNVLMIQEKAVTYINVDTCVAGDIFSPVMTPTLNSASYRIARLIPDPVNSSETLYQSWLRKMTEYGKVGPTGQIIPGPLGLYSDYGAFAFYAGIPVMDISWLSQKGGAIVYPVYHSIYETIYYVETFLDPAYRRHVSCTQFSGLLMQYFSDSAILPFDFEDWVNTTINDFVVVEEWSDVLENSLNITLGPIKEMLNNLLISMKTWKSFVKQVDKQNPYALRSLNDHMMLLHRAFLNRVPLKTETSWILRYGIDENYATLYDLLSSPELSTKAGAVEDKLLIVQKHLTDFTLKVQQLTTFLNGGYY